MLRSMVTQALTWKASLLANPARIKIPACLAYQDRPRILQSIRLSVRSISGFAANHRLGCCPADVVRGKETSLRYYQPSPHYKKRWNAEHATCAEARVPYWLSRCGHASRRRALHSICFWAECEDGQANFAHGGFLAAMSFGLIAGCSKSPSGKAAASEVAKRTLSRTLSH